MEIHFYPLIGIAVLAALVFGPMILCLLALGLSAYAKWLRTLYRHLMRDLRDHWK